MSQAAGMGKSRLEAFSDAVIAIILTIMVLELKVPHAADWSALKPLLPVFLSYVLSFVYIGIYWNNHHHLWHAAKRVDGRILWANLHLMFWLSLVPFVTGGMGENHLAALPVALYGVVLLCCALSYTLLVLIMVSQEREGSLRAYLTRSTVKNWISMASYVSAIPLAFVNVWISCVLYAGVALLWLMPDRGVEQALAED